MNRAAQPKGKYPSRRKKAQQSSQNSHLEEIIYDYFLSIVKTWSSELVIFEFKRLFVDFVFEADTRIGYALHQIIYANNQSLFLNVLKRCIYILVNNWQAGRNHKAIHEIIQVFDEKTISDRTLSPTVKRLRIWLATFAQSQDYQELKLFVSKHEDQTEDHWSHRYTSYLLVTHYIDPNNPKEQREAAKVLSQQLKEKFKLNLAMYAARSQSPVKSDTKLKNPTNLGDDVLRLIKTIVAKRGSFSYANLANIFLKQTQEVTYLEFKKALQRYLIFSLNHQGFIDIFNKKLGAKLECLNEERDREIISPLLLLKTCNKLLEYLTTENNGEPSLLFILLLSQGNPLTLAIVLLKIILICPSSYIHLEAQLGKLIRYYESHQAANCDWFIKFLEIFKITFAIQAENVEYNLIKLQRTVGEKPSTIDADNYRIFSQAKKIAKESRSAHD